MVEYEDASPEVRAVYDDIMKTRGTDLINNFWKALANDPPTLRRTWESIKQVIVKSLISVQPVLRNNYRSVLPPDNDGFSCFEVLG